VIRPSADSPLPYLEFAPLTVKQVSHRFTLRKAPPFAEVQTSLRLSRFPVTDSVQAEQIHGSLVVSVSKKDYGSAIPQADALITAEKKLPLTIRTADCGPVYFYDPVRLAIGLAHSGKKGTAGNITGLVISAMGKEFGSQPQDLIVVLGPCIRPPNYEIDFAAEIGRQAQAAGVVNYFDCGLNTATDLTSFYSYRMEKGNTGRHYAFLMLND
jgi:polyphenol oxidase